MQTASSPLTSGIFYTSYILPYKDYYEGNVCGYKEKTDANLRVVLGVEKKYGGPGILLPNNLDITINITSEDDQSTILSAFVAQSAIRPHLLSLAPNIRTLS